MSLALVHSAGPVSPGLEALARRRLSALLVVAWERNRRLAMRLADYSERFRQQAQFGLEDGSGAVVRLQLLSAFARARAESLLSVLRARGVRLTVRLPAWERYEGLAAELDNLHALSEAYGSLHDLALHAERDLALVHRVAIHVEELTALVRALDTFSRVLAA